jgi:hypothetical protein
MSGFVEFVSKRKHRYLLVPLGLRVFADDVVDGLGDRSLKPDVAALGADQGRDVLDAIKLLAPRLRVGDDFSIKPPAALGTLI